MGRLKRDTGSNVPICDIEIAEKHCSSAAGFNCEADRYVGIGSSNAWTRVQIPTSPSITEPQPILVGVFYCPKALE
jgi:hypothetical protein